MFEKVDKITISEPPQMTNAKSSSLREATESRGTAFVSYRREGGADTARLLRRELQDRGWHVFLDVDDLPSCHFDDRLLLEIQDAMNFILILSPGCLDRCDNEKDWVRREIAHAISRQKNIVPVLKDGFEFPNQQEMPENIQKLPSYHCIEYSHAYFGPTVDKLESFLASVANESA